MGPQGNSTHRLHRCFHCHQMGHIRKMCPLWIAHPRQVRTPARAAPVAVTPRVTQPTLPRPVPMRLGGPVVARSSQWGQQHRPAPYPTTQHANGVWRQTNHTWAPHRGGMGGNVRPVQECGGLPMLLDPPTLTPTLPTVLPTLPTVVPTAQPTQLAQALHTLQILLQLWQQY